MLFPVGADKAHGQAPDPPGGWIYDSANYAMWLTRTDGEIRHLLLDEPGVSIDACGKAPSGKVTFIGEYDPVRGGQVYVTDFDGGNRHQVSDPLAEIPEEYPLDQYPLLVRNYREPSWVPGTNCTKVVLLSKITIGSNWKVWILDVETAIVELVIDTPVNVASPTSDGTHIFFTSIMDDTVAVPEWNIYRVNVNLRNGTPADATRLTHDHDFDIVDIDAKAGLLAYVQGSDLYLADSNGQNTNQVASGGGPELTEDGKWLMYGTIDGTYLFKTDRSSAAVLVPNAYSGTIMLDEQNVPTPPISTTPRVIYLPKISNEIELTPMPEEEFCNGSFSEGRVCWEVRTAVVDFYPSGGFPSGGSVNLKRGSSIDTGGAIRNTHMVSRVCGYAQYSEGTLGNGASLDIWGGTVKELTLNFNKGDSSWRYFKLEFDSERYVSFAGYGFNINDDFIKLSHLSTLCD